MTWEAVALSDGRARAAAAAVVVVVVGVKEVGHPTSSDPAARANAPRLSSPPLILHCSLSSHVSRRLPPLFFFVRVSSLSPPLVSPSSSILRHAAAVAAAAQRGGGAGGGGGGRDLSDYERKLRAKVASS